MRKTVTIAVILALCVALLEGCTGKTELTGVYTSQAAAENIILYKDGTAEYLGADNATWKVRADTLTITLHHPETYYLDVYLDNTILTEAEMRATATQINRLENVISCDYTAEANWFRVELRERDHDGSTATNISQLSGVINVEEFIAPAWTTDHDLTILDGCLVKETTGIKDVIFEKVGN